ncbi:hypothetical protein ACVWW6_000138 [Bradyrhizobium sp. USDA 3311]
MSPATDGAGSGRPDRAAYGEKNPERLAPRNGYRDTTWETRAGTLELRIPKLRKGSYFPGFLEPRWTAEKTLTAVVQACWLCRHCNEMPASASARQTRATAKLARLF